MKLALLGTYDVDNYGDCLFPTIIRAQFAKRLKKFSLHLYSPTSRVSPLGQYKTVTGLPGEAVRTIDFNGMDACLLSGGDTIWSGSRLGTYSALPYESMSAGMRLWFWPAAFKALSGGHALVHSCGVGEISSEAVPLFQECAEEYDWLSVRDVHSQRKLESVGVHAPVSADIASVIRDTFDDGELVRWTQQLLQEQARDEGYIVVQASLGYVEKCYPEWLDAICEIERKVGLPLVLLPICRFLGDLVFLRKVEKDLKMRNVKCTLVADAAPVEQTTAILANGRAYVGTSLHGAIVSEMYGRQSVVLSKSVPGKHDGVLARLGVSDAVVTSVGDLPARLMQRLKSEAELGGGASLREEVRRETHGEFDRLASLLTEKPRIPKGSWDSLRRTAVRVIKAECDKGEGERWKHQVISSLRRFDSVSEVYDRLRFEMKSFALRV